MCLYVEGYADYSGAKRGDLLLLMLLTDHTDQEGVVVGDLDQLEEDTGYPRKTIEASLRRLEKMGKLRRLTDNLGRVFGRVHSFTREQQNGWHIYRAAGFDDNGKEMK